MMMREKNSSLYLISGVVIGILIGLIYSIILDPVTYIDNHPSSLEDKAKNELRQLIAQAYNVNGDLGRAKERLELLDDKNGVSMLALQAQELLSQGGNDEVARNLAMLANDLESGKSSIAAAEHLQSPENPINQGNEQLSSQEEEIAGEEKEVQPTFTPNVKPTMIPTLSSPFQMEYKELICEQELPDGLLQIEILDNNGNPIPGVKIEVTWQDGSDYFYTGLYPEINPGYADFVMEETIVYSLRVENSSDIVEAIEAPLCDGGNKDDYYGGWWYRFMQ